MLVGVVGLSLPVKTRVSATDPVGLVALTCIWKPSRLLAGNIKVSMGRLVWVRCYDRPSTRPHGGANQAGSFHIRDMIRDMSLTGLHVSLLVFLVTIMQRKQGLCRHFAFHGMFHAMLVQRKPTRIEKCSHGIR